jgi:hypothetical protein
MKPRKKPRLRTHQHTSLVIINVYHRLNTEELDSLVSSILADPDKNDRNINHCLFIGDRLLITPIISRISYCYNVQWFGEYCLASYTLGYCRYIHTYNIEMRPMQSLEIHLMGLKLLYTPKITKLSHILDYFQLLKLDVCDIDMICSCNTKYEGGDYQEWMHFEYHKENGPGLHYFIPDRNTGYLTDEVIQYFPNNSFAMCVIDIIDTQLEHLENCWHPENIILRYRMRSENPSKAII